MVTVVLHQHMTSTFTTVIDRPVGTVSATDFLHYQRISGPPPRHTTLEAPLWSLGPYKGHGTLPLCWHDWFERARSSLVVPDALDSVLFTDQSQFTQRYINVFYFIFCFFFNKTAQLRVALECRQSNRHWFSNHESWPAVESLFRGEKGLINMDLDSFVFMNESWNLKFNLGKVARKTKVWPLIIQ